MSRTLHLVAWFSLLGACDTGAPVPPGPDQPAPADAAAQVGVVAGSERYYEVSQQLCPSPACAGVQIDPVNTGDWTCPVGVEAKSCQAHEIDWSETGLDADGVADAEQALAAGRLLLRGHVSTAPDPYLYGGTAVTLHATEAWLGGTGSEPLGRFVRARSSGIVCITYPCPVYDENHLNGRRQNELAELDFSHSGADDEQVATAFGELESGPGLIVSGRGYEVNGPAGSMLGRGVTEFYLRLE